MRGEQREHRRDAYERELAFLNKYLRNPTARVMLTKQLAGRNRLVAAAGLANDFPRA